MPIGVLDPGTDEFDLAVNFGGYRYYMFFGAGPHCSPLPSTPPPAGGTCRCPSCASDGWFAASPVCKYWNAHCDVCAGTRFWLDYSAGRPPKRQPCELCLEAWREDVRWFRDALRNPRGTARRLRDEATARRAAQQQTEPGDQS